MKSRPLPDVRDYLKFDPEKGHVKLFDQRMLLMHGFSMAELRRELIERLGYETARRVFTRLGYQQGIEDQVRIRGWLGDEVRSILPLGPRLRDLEGYVGNLPHHFELDEKEGTFFGDFTWVDSWEAEGHLKHFGTGGAPVCWINAGYATAFATHVLGKPILAREIECVAMGHDRCRAVMKPVSDWHDDAIARDLGFLQLEDFIDPPVSGGVSRFDATMTLPKAINHHASELIGASPAFNRTVFLLKRVAKTDSTVLFLGESGVGKERFSRVLHDTSGRSNGPFVSVNCAAIPENLVEAELFGVERGAFTGASRSRAGKFERAQGGTLFLDEIGSLPMPAQGKLLRAIQEREVERVGGADVRSVDVRIVAATNDDLRQSVEDGRFRADLFFRLNVFPIQIPPLRDRKEDIPLLLTVFLERFSERFGKNLKGITRSAFNKLYRYQWPGNVRELENMVERAAILADPEGVLDVHHLFSGGEKLDLVADSDAPIGEMSVEAGVASHDTGKDMMAIDALLSNGATLEQIEESVIVAALERHGGKLAPAARELGLRRGQMQYRVAKLRERGMGKC